MNAAIRLTTVFLLTVFWSLAPPSLQAKQIYKYQDENGIWHFSDLPPETSQPVEVRNLRTDPKPRLLMRRLGADDNPFYRFQNQLYGPMQVELHLQNERNVSTEPPLPRRFVLEPRETRDLVRMSPAAAGYGWSYQLAYRWTPGDPRAIHRSTESYLPPFPATDAYWISQAFEGSLTHTTPDSKYAVDIVMPEGTPVLAARSGIVMDVEDDFFGGGTDRERFGKRANIVRILHEDDTMAVYAHLQLDSIRVRPGSVVLMGEQIASSGNTGFTSGPHLHFAVQHNTDMQLVSVPFNFLMEAGGRIRPAHEMMVSGVEIPATGID